MELDGLNFGKYGLCKKVFYDVMFFQADFSDASDGVRIRLICEVLNIESKSFS
jgi:hypothetical protein